MGGTGVCFCCDCARLLWGESLTLYLLLGTTCLLLLDTGSHLHPNVKLLISESVWFCWGQKPCVTPHNNQFTQSSFLSCTFTSGWSSPCMTFIYIFLFLWKHWRTINGHLCGIRLTASIEEWTAGRTSKLGAYKDELCPHLSWARTIQSVKTRTPALDL